MPTARAKVGCHRSLSLEPRMSNTPESLAAQLIWQHWQAGSTLDHLPTAHRPQTRAQGYAAQACLPAAAHRTVVGWKIAATS